jgi:FkbM family methyltransferase
MIINFFHSLAHYSRSLGITKGIEAKIKFRFVNKGLVRISLNYNQGPFSLRANTSDVEVFEQIFVSKEYEFKINFEPEFIVDGGANIGLSSIFFANKFPKARIIAIEPEESNFSLLKSNTSQYVNISVHNAAIWNEKLYLAVKDLGYGKWGFITEKSHNEDLNNVATMTIQEIMEINKLNCIDILN